MRSIGLRLRSRGSLRQSPLAVLFLEESRVHAQTGAKGLGLGATPSDAQGLILAHC